MTPTSRIVEFDVPRIPKRVPCYACERSSFAGGEDNAVLVKSGIAAALAQPFKGFDVALRHAAFPFLAAIAD